MCVSGIKQPRSETCIDKPFDSRKTADLNFSFVHSVNGAATFKVVTVPRKWKPNMCRCRLFVWLIFVSFDVACINTK
jgi:hypothetical protein